MFGTLREKFAQVLSNLSRRGKLSEEDIDNALREIRRSLLEADVNFKVVKDLIAKIRERAVSLEVLQSITANDRIAAILYEELINLMGRDVQNINISPKPPTVILMVGLQGSGKTTTTVKLARVLKNNNHNPLVVACDLRRPAAVDQLKILADAAKIPFYGDKNLKLDKVIKDAQIYAENHLNDVIILDTAGRLQIDDDLMSELKHITEILPPHEKLLVIDAMTGQEAVNVAKSFHDLLNLTGLILTKLDGDARGGSALAIRAVTGVPVKFAGVGENTDALEIFNPERMAGRIMGMGDVQGLVEKVREAGLNSNLDISKIKPEKLNKQFNLEMLLSQFEQIEKLGPIEKLAGMIPGLSNINFNRGSYANNAISDAKILKRNKAIIQSMTPEERRNPRIIKGSRRRRIAEGSGTSVQMVNQLLAQYEQMKKLFKEFSNNNSRFGLGRKLKNLFGLGR